MHASYVVASTSSPMPNRWDGNRRSKLWQVDALVLSRPIATIHTCIHMEKWYENTKIGIEKSKRHAKITYSRHVVGCLNLNVFRKWFTLLRFVWIRFSFAYSSHIHRFAVQYVQIRGAPHPCSGSHSYLHIDRPHRSIHNLRSTKRTKSQYRLHSASNTQACCNKQSNLLIKFLHFSFLNILVLEMLFRAR